MGKFDGLIGRMILAMLLVVGLFSFIITMQSDNNAAQPAADDETFNKSFSGLIQQVENSTDPVQEKYNVFNSEEPAAGFGSINLFTIVSVGKTVSNLVASFFGAAINFPLVILGIAPNIYNLLGTWLIILIIVAAWLFYKLGGERNGV